MFIFSCCRIEYAHFLIVNADVSSFFDTLIFESVADKLLLICIQVELWLAVHNFLVNFLEFERVVLLSFELEALHIFLLFLHKVHDPSIANFSDILGPEVVWVAVLERLQLKCQLSGINAVDIMPNLQAADKQVSLELKYL